VEPNADWVCGCPNALAPPPKPLEPPPNGVVEVVEPNAPVLAPPNGVLVCGCCPNPVDAGAPNPPAAGVEPNELVVAGALAPKPPNDAVGGLAPNADVPPPNGVLVLG